MPKQDRLPCQYANPADTMSEDDLTMVSADSESRDMATRRSRGHKKNRSDRRRASKAKRVNNCQRRAEQDTVWQRPEHDLTLCSPYMHFAEQLRHKSSSKIYGPLTPIPLESFPIIKLPTGIRVTILKMVLQHQKMFFCKCPRSLERCGRVQELKITAITNNRFTDMGHILYDENIHGEFDKLLEPFADVRGLGEFLFTGKPWLREQCGMEGCYPVGNC